jgi:CRISPR/Cas system CSM-associated protein Csm5 (group 7 of RAMP superfamily)
MIKIEESMRTQTFEVEIITPTHIGGAAENHWQNGMDFVVRDNKTWILNFKKLSKEISIDDLTLAFTRNDRNKSLDKIVNNETLNKVLYKKFEYNTMSSEIKRQIFNGFDGKPYIPGSSIKGAVSSILLKYFFRLPTANIQKNKDIVKNTLGGGDNSIMRFFQFTDIQFKDSQLINTKIFNLKSNNNGGWEGGWKHNRETNQKFNNEFTTVYETLKPKHKSTMMLSFKQKAIEQLYLDARIADSKTKTPPRHTSAWITNNPTAELCEIINKHTIAFLEKEVKFYEKYKFDDNSENTLENIKRLRKRVSELDSEKECILRLAAGSGFHSITGDWQYDDYFERIGVWTEEDSRNKLCKRGDIGKQKYKSRKLAFENGNFLLMGFIKLTLLTKEEIEKAKQQAIEDEEKRKVERRIFEENEIKRKEQDAIVEAERIEKERIDAEEAKKPKMHEGAISKGLEVDAEVIYSQKPNKVKIYVKGYEDKLFDMTDSAPQPKGYICRVSLVIEKGRILRVIHKIPK